jgi:protocatechuate 3,4-dioxygenase beta subunit
MKIRLAVAMLALTLATIAGQEAGTASIEGTVTRAGTIQPLANVRVTGENLGTKTRFTTATNPAGAFSLTGLSAGTYRLTFAARGYIEQVYGQKIDGSTWMPIEVARGVGVKDVVVRLTPTGSIEGRVLDTAGRPAVSAPVTLLRPAYDAEGKKTLSTVVVTETDDRGEYRIFWIAPGRYYLRVGGRVGFSTGRNPIGGRISDGNKILETFAEAFYPDTPSADFAVPIEIRAGADLQSLDFRVRHTALFHIRGRVIDAQTGPPPADANIGISGDGWSWVGGSPYIKDGTFEVGGLWPGSYDILVFLREILDGRERRLAQATDYASVRIVDKNIDDVVLRLLPLIGVSGLVFLEGNPPPPGLSVRLRNTDVNRGPLPTTPTAPVNADGSFKVAQLVPGNYQVAVSDPALYVKQARFGGVDGVNSLLKFAGGDSSTTLEITLSPKVAQVSGTVTDTLLQPVAGARVVLVPDRGRHRRDVFKEATSDGHGRYVFTNVTPGDYKIYAWEAIESRAWYDAEVLKRFEQGARSIRLRESANETIDAKLIPAETL